MIRVIGNKIEEERGREEDLHDLDQCLRPLKKNELVVILFNQLYCLFEMLERSL